MTTSAIYLKEVASGKLVRATLFDEVTDAHLAMWNETWRPAMAAHCTGRTLQDKPEDQPWDWQTKAKCWRPLLSYHFFAIVCRHELQGLMVANETATFQAVV